MAATNPSFEAFSKVRKPVREIYCYTTPGVPAHNGWVKVGQTVQGAEKRIQEQTHTADIEYTCEWVMRAEYTIAPYDTFTDKDFHRYLREECGIEQKLDVNGNRLEWFKETPNQIQDLLNQFAMRRARKQGSVYSPRKPQLDCRVKTLRYLLVHPNGAEFLWDAKPRFGKTVTAYDTMLHYNPCGTYLVVTNRPVVANSWLDDYIKFVAWCHPELCFVSDAPALRNRTGTMSWEEYEKNEKPKGHGCIIFESLQDLKGSVYFGGKHDKLGYLANIKFDIKFIDEAHEGIDTLKTDFAFSKLQSVHTVYMTGTGFKLLASDRFSEDQIFSWSYADEQDAKRRWDLEPETMGTPNPYADLPQYKMYTYQLSRMIFDRLSREQAVLDDEFDSYAFDLNEFFATDAQGEFVHSEKVDMFLDCLSSNPQYPFGNEHYRQTLRHTVWFLNRVNSAKALARKLAEHAVFGDYEVIIAAGDGKLSEDDELSESQALPRVKKAIQDHGKTITITVGQLTTGITVPEWTGILMLCNLMSPELYFQAIARTQNPCELESDGDQLLRKEYAYVFDFDPARTLTLYDAYANDLSYNMAKGIGSEKERAANIREMLNFFPVIGEDEDGQMVELDAEELLRVPRKLKSEEVVRHGFLSNYLFVTGHVFGMPPEVSDIISKITPEKAPKEQPTAKDLELLDKVKAGADGTPDVPDKAVLHGAAELLGSPVYDEFVDGLDDVWVDIASDDISGKLLDDKAKMLISKAEAYVDRALSGKGVSPSARKKAKKAVRRQQSEKIESMKMEYEQRKAVAEAEYRSQVESAATSAEVEAAKEQLAADMDAAKEELAQVFNEIAENSKTAVPKDLAEQIAKIEASDAQAKVEEATRAHLRGLARTIPTFIMAYGDRNLRLSNLDEYVDADVFEEVTGITVDDFRFLRDGGDYLDEEGEEHHFDGHLFDEIVFDDSMQRFLDKKDELGDWTRPDQPDDIFDYIPPQKTNQIYTPRKVVKMQVEEVAANRPGCFDNPGETFLDPYMKSGLYIVEAAKKLHASAALKAAFPDSRERLLHILRHQVYGIAPTKITMLVALTYIFGFDSELLAQAKAAAMAGEPFWNFAVLDGIAACKDSGAIARFCEEPWGEQLLESDEAESV